MQTAMLIRFLSVCSYLLSRQPRPTAPTMLHFVAVMDELYWWDRKLRLLMQASHQVS